MASILVHVTHGPEHPTRVTMAFLVARTAVEEGHDVSVFLSGDGAQLIRDAVLDTVVGVGTGKLREHFDALVSGGARFFVSGLSAQARDVTEADLSGKPAGFAMPAQLVKFALDHDRLFTY